MRTKLTRWLLTSSIAGATLLGVPTIAAAQPVERDHRRVPPGGPREAPPPPKLERVEARAGFVWVPGRWDWRGRWEWTSGHWERERAGKKWREGRWERRGDDWIFNDGDWIDVDVRPRAAPPPLREERWEPRAGFVWIRGRWDWRNGNWDWLPGHWERERAGKHWREARWELRDGVYVLVDGDWADVELYPTAAPPPLREERWEPRAGFVWIRGRWDWRAGNWDWVPGHWERERAGQRWNEGRWELRDGRYVWVEGVWGQPPLYPTSPPPPLRAEQPIVGPDRVWIPGRWKWQDGAYVWVPGYGTSREGHEGKHFEPGTWNRVGDHWEWTNGNWFWDVVGPTVAPPAPVVENPGTRDGFFWIRGHHQWVNGRYEWLPGHWERARANYRWIEGRWEQRGNAWVWVEGHWG